MNLAGGCMNFRPQVCCLQGGSTVTMIHPLVLFDGNLPMKSIDNRLTTLLQRIHLFELLNMGVFVTGLSMLFAATSAGGVVDRMEAAYPLSRGVVGGLVLMGALVMGVSTNRRIKLIGWLPFALYVAGVWGVTYNGYATQAAIAYTTQALALYLLIIRPDQDHAKE